MITITPIHLTLHKIPHNPQQSFVKTSKQKPQDTQIANDYPNKWKMMIIQAYLQNTSSNNSIIIQIQSQLNWTIQFNHYKAYNDV